MNSRTQKLLNKGLASFEADIEGRLKMASDGEKMMKEIYKTFQQLQTQYPRITTHLQECYYKIQEEMEEPAATHAKPPIDKKEAKKEKLAKTLKSSIDMTHLMTTYNGLMEEQAMTTVNLIDLLKKLNQAISSSRKKGMQYAVRKGLLLKQTKKILPKASFNRVREECNYSMRHINFLIALHELCVKFPRVQYCNVPILTFKSNFKVVKQICEEDSAFWKNTA